MNIVAMRVGGDHADALFVMPFCAPIAPTRAVVRVLAHATPTAITTTLSNDPANVVDATALIESVRAMSEGDAVNGCAPHATSDANGDGVMDTFTGAANEAVCFEITPAPAGAWKRGATERFVDAFLDVAAPSDPSLAERRFIYFAIPPFSGAPTC